MPSGEPILELTGITKNYQALRPLRIQQLAIDAGDSVAVIGLDATAAEVLVNLVTGATLPDTGSVMVMGEPTSAITTGDEWLRTLERFGLLSDRSVLVEQLTVEQNLAMPFSLDFDALGDAIRSRVRSLAEEVGLASSDLSRPAGSLSAAAQLRTRFGRALALDPRILVAAHPNAALSADDTPAFAADFSRIIERRRLTTLVVTSDRVFAQAVAGQVLTLEPATGALKATSGWRRWFMP